MVLSGKLVVSAALLCVAVGCGVDKVEKAAGTGEELADATIDLNIKNLGVTLNRVRVYKGLDPSTGPTRIGQRDFHLLEIWHTPDGETLPRQWQSGVEYVADDEGNLHAPGSRSAQIEQSGRTVFDAKGAASFEVWTRVAKTALMKTLPALHEFETYSTDASGVRTVTKNQTKLTDLDKAGKGVANRYGRFDPTDAMTLGPRADSRFVKTTGLKGRIGCEITTTKTATSGSVRSVAYSFYDIELGDTLLDNDNVFSTGTTTTFGDRTLYARQVTQWYVVGANVLNRTLQLVRKQSMGLYTNRSLPAKKDATTFVPSGLEIALRECHKAALSADPTTETKSFSLMRFAEDTDGTPNALVPIATLSDIPYCEEWGNAADQAKEFSTLAGIAPNCSRFRTRLSAFKSNWDGAKYSGDTPTTESLARADYDETSAVTEVAF